MPPVVFSDKPRPGRRAGPVSIGSLVFPQLDQIDFTGPFEVFSRIPDAQIHVVSKTLEPVRDVKGLILTPTTPIGETPLFDVLHVAGGLGQQAIMDDPEIIGLIRRHAEAGRLVFSVPRGRSDRGTKDDFQGWRVCSGLCHMSRARRGRSKASCHARTRISR